ncbi:hypothetical protein EDD15DRAFT_2203338 [Pisolithus albus]|nr:hypothetical protein EDD15DRAFT_2203338 [Pisolithus albus]
MAPLYDAVATSVVIGAVQLCHGAVSRLDKWGPICQPVSSVARCSELSSDGQQVRDLQMDLVPKMWAREMKALAALMGEIPDEAADEKEAREWLDRYYEVSDQIEGLRKFVYDMSTEVPEYPDETEEALGAVFLTLAALRDRFPRRSGKPKRKRVLPSSNNVPQDSEGVRRSQRQVGKAAARGDEENQTALRGLGGGCEEEVTAPPPIQTETVGGATQRSDDVPEVAASTTQVDSESYGKPEHHARENFRTSGLGAKCIPHLGVITMPEWWVVVGINEFGICDCTCHSLSGIPLASTTLSKTVLLCKEPSKWGPHFLGQNRNAQICFVRHWLIWYRSSATTCTYPSSTCNSQVHSTSPQNTDIDEVDQLFQDVHIESPGLGARGCTANLSVMRNALPTFQTTHCSMPSQPSEYLMDPQPLLQRSAQQTTPAQPSCRLPSRASPIVYTHIRSLRGIMASRYHYSANTATQTHALPLGPHMGQDGTIISDLTAVEEARGNCQ